MSLQETSVRFLLVKPHVSLTVARRLHAFLHLEPLELEIVAGAVAAPHRVRILDLTLHKRPLATFRRTLRREQPDVVGLTGFSNQAQNVKTLAALAKAEYPDIRVMVGGMHATIAPEDFGNGPHIDWIVRGEGATVMRSIVRHLGQGRIPPQNERLLHAGSPAFADLARLPPPEPPADFSEIPAPRRDLTERGRYFCAWSGRPGERLPALFPPTASMRTSTGCPYRCAFCVVPYVSNGRYLKKEPHAVADEIASVPESHIYFVDDEMFLDAERTAEIARELLRRGIRKQYISWARCDTIVRHPDLFRLWKEAGLDLLYVGIESMQEKNLKDYNKRCDAETNRRAVALLRDIGIGLHAALMVNPDFTREDFLQVRETVAQLGPAEFSFTVFSPPPGTPLWKERQAEFIGPDPYAFYDCMHTLLPARLPLKTFYRYFSLLYLFGFRDNPWRRNGVRTTLRDRLRLLRNGACFGWALHNIYKDYLPATVKASRPIVKQLVNTQTHEQGP
jgi:hopanoid C-3 methylase